MRARYIAGWAAVGALGATLAVVYLTWRSCTESDSHLAGALGGPLAAPVLAITAAALLRFRPTWAWIGVVVISPVVAFYVALFLAGAGDNVHDCHVHF